MAINIKNQIFTLHTKNSTYQMKVDEQNMLIHTYYGNRTDDTDCSYLIRMADRGFSGNIPGTDRERVYSLDFLDVYKRQIYINGIFSGNSLSW